MRAFRTVWLPLVLVALSCAGLGSPRVPDTPDGTVRFVATGLAESRPQVLWQALPSSWQADVTALLHESAEKTDPELYELGWSVAGKVARILDEKQDFILDHPMLAGRIEDREKTEALLHAGAGFLRTLTESELADREALRTLDVETFLAGTGAKLLGDARELSTLLQGLPGDLPVTAPHGTFRLNQLQLEDVAVIQRDGGSARLRLVTGGGASAEQDWVQVEERWVPKQMADTWPKALAKAHRQLASAMPASAERNQALIVQLRMVDGALEAVLATRTAGEFQAAAGAAFGTILGSAMAQAPSQSSSAPSSALPSPPVAGLQPSAPGAPETGNLLRAHPIALREARRHIGATVHVVAIDGDEFDGTLRAADGRTLTLERESPAGTMTHAMALNEVRILQIWK
ncbi:MAG TPA: hypothetical protein VFV75_11770 [Candidatus Polarisedimenticolaceae bacterium]|nr:hypothetical protein [Candidatus Polarisedimenticolaceae bacterium]